MYEQSYKEYIERLEYEPRETQFIDVWSHQVRYRSTITYMPLTSDGEGRWRYCARGRGRSIARR